MYYQLTMLEGSDNRCSHHKTSLEREANLLLGSFLAVVGRRRRCVAALLLQHFLLQLQHLDDLGPEGQPGATD